MNKQKKNKPFNDLKCIWMDAMIKFKLCDKNFDCENCIFDKVMSNIKLEPSHFALANEVNIFDKKMQELQELKYQNNLVYLKNNIVLKNLFGNTFYLGISPVARVLLDETSGFNYCKDGVPMQAEYPIAQFFGNWGSYKIHSPINFYCLGRLKQEIHNDTPLEWFLLIETYPTEIEQARITKEDYDSNITKINNYFDTLNHEAAKLGVMMNDGGERVETLHEALSNVQYQDLLHLLFSQS